MNQTQGQRVISSITGSVQGTQLGGGNQAPSGMGPNKIPTFTHKGQQKGKHGFSKSITDSAAVNKNMTGSVGLSQNITRQNHKLNEQYRSHQSRESTDGFFNSKDRFGGTTAQLTTKLTTTNQR